MWQESPSARKLGSSRSPEVEAWTRDYWLWVWWFFSTSEKHVRYKTYQNLERWKLWNTKYESLKKPSLRSDHHGWQLVISLLYGSITHIISNTQSKSSIFDFHSLKWSSAFLDGCKLIYSCCKLLTLHHLQLLTGVTVPLLVVFSSIVISSADILAPAYCKCFWWMLAVTSVSMLRLLASVITASRPFSQLSAFPFTLTSCQPVIITVRYGMSSSPCTHTHTHRHKHTQYTQVHRHTYKTQVSAGRNGSHGFSTTQKDTL